ncbi:MAG: LysM peptidoglycan-binding domain-containing protein [Gammaproteobacteria bacterium]
MKKNFQRLLSVLALFLSLFSAGNLYAEKTIPETNQDFWDAVRNEFYIEEPENSRIQQHRNWYFNHPDYLGRVLTRARPYLWHIRLEILRRGMPGELLLLPLVESAFSPHVSSNWSAVGLWQFIPTTARRFKLASNEWYDARRDVLQSTEAALDYLEILHRRFNNDWLLAIAAYNSGEGTVSRAIKRNRKAGKPVDFWNLNLPRETRAYVPNLLAVASLITNPDLYNIELPEIADAPYFEVIDVESAIDLATAAELADMPLQEMENLNPGFLTGLIPPEGPKRLLLPIEKSGQFIVALETANDRKNSRWKKHQVKSGDTLGQIARQYGTSIKVIKYTNNLVNNTIKINQTLRIPADIRSDRLKRKQTVKSYVVKRGDTLWDIARKHNVSVKMLRRWNQLQAKDHIKPGKRLKLAAN